MGYQAHTPEGLEEVLNSLGVERLVDVRTAPWSRKPGFSKQELAARFGQRYEWRGDILGGKGGAITEDAIGWLAAQSGHILLLCMEDDPCKCHRYWLIARRLLALGIECIHIQGGRQYTTGELRERCGDVPPWERQGRLDLS